MNKLKQIKPTPEILKELEEKVEYEEIKTKEERKLKEFVSKHFVSLRVAELKIKPNLVNLKISELKLKSIKVDTYRNFAPPKPSESPNLRLNVKMELSNKLLSPSKLDLQVKTAVKTDTLQPKQLPNLNLTSLEFALKTDYAVVVREFPSLKAVNIGIKTSSNCSTSSSQNVIAPAVDTATISTKITSTTEIPAKTRSFPIIQSSSLILHGNISVRQKSMLTLKHTDLSPLIAPLRTTPTKLRSDLFPNIHSNSIGVRIVSITQESIVGFILNLTPKAFELELNTVNQIQQEFPALRSKGVKVTPNVDTKPIESHRVLNISTEDLKLKLSPLHVRFETRLTFQDLIESLTEASAMGILEEILNVVKGYLPRGGSEALDKPVFVIVGEDKRDWHNIVAYTLSELYMEIRGEKPIPTIRELNNEDSVDSTVERFLMVNFKPWGKVEVLDARDFDRSRLRSFIQKLRGRLLSSYLQGLGFFVIVTRNEYVKDVEELLKDVGGIDKIIIQPEYERVKTADFAILRPSDEKIVDRRYRKAVFSVLGIEHGNFLKAVEIRDSKIRSIVKSLSPFVPKTESESEHYPLKVAVFSWIVSKEFEKSNSKPKNRDEFIRFVKALIDTGIVSIEKPIEQFENVIPDIIYRTDDETVYIEIETLVGTEDPIAKIQKTISKYVDNKIEGRTWIVLKPVSALIHYSNLKNLKKFYDATLSNNPVQFKVLIYENNRWNLIDIDEFARRLK